jgi:Tol biopolymer transport system component
VTPFIADARSFEASLSLSRDGKQIAVVVPNSRGTYETWTASIDRPNLRRVLALPNADCSGATWSPTGEWLAFNRNGRDKDDGVYVQRSDGSGEAKAVYKIGSMEEGSRRQRLDGRRERGSRHEVHSGQDRTPDGASLADGTASPPKAMRESKSSLAGALASPDGKLVLFKSDESGRANSMWRDCQGNESQASRCLSTPRTWTAINGARTASASTSVRDPGG